MSPLSPTPVAVPRCGGGCPQACWWPHTCTIPNPPVAVPTVPTVPNPCCGCPHLRWWLSPLSSTLVVTVPNAGGCIPAQFPTPGCSHCLSPHGCPHCPQPPVAVPNPPWLSPLSPVPMAVPIVPSPLWLSPTPHGCPHCPQSPWLSPLSPAPCGCPQPPWLSPLSPAPRGCPQPWWWLSPGSLVAAYRKLHLFDAALPGQPALCESSFTNPGQELLPPIDTPVGKVLLRARAIECQCYVVAAAQCGRHNATRASFGHSLVADPWGAVVAQCHEGPGLCLAHIDLAYLEQVRRELPVHGHRRGDIYGTPTGTPGT
uniref:Uncharacterized protein n=1 Tax=Geospiza parvula TaxID=87175 RepID=A0A8U8CGW3_GEOPR